MAILLVHWLPSSWFFLSGFDGIDFLHITPYLCHIGV
jgi:hypothetical protein